MFELLSSHSLLPDTAHLLAFGLASFALNVTPGADMAFVAATSARGGARSGVAAALGVGAGSLVHLTAATVGLSALIASFQTMFTVLKWAGAAYLVYMAVGMLRGGPSQAKPAAPPRSNAALFRAGALVNVMNPKVGLFFIAFLPQFVDRVPEVGGRADLPSGFVVQRVPNARARHRSAHGGSAAAGLRGVRAAGRQERVCVRVRFASAARNIPLLWLRAHARSSLSWARSMWASIPELLQIRERALVYFGFKCSHNGSMLRIRQFRATRQSGRALSLLQ